MVQELSNSKLIKKLFHQFRYDHFTKNGLRLWPQGFFENHQLQKLIFEKSNFCQKINFNHFNKINPNIFTSFSPKKKIDNFFGKSKLNFWTKNEDFD